MISVGQTVGNYQITAKLGEGGMGVVYLAEHPVIGKKVAIKAIHPELSKNPEVISRFMTEAKSVNQIGHEHIVDISDFGNTEDGEFFFVMEFLQGEALSDRLSREHRFPAVRALKIAAQVADALSASHEQGIIHRDLKPENVYLINRGANVDFVKVLDFGLAKLTQGDAKVTHKTRTGSVMGTPYYMSPEQCEGRADVDHRSDVYALGVILFEMLTGKVPFGGEGYGEIIVKHITQPAPFVRAINPTLEEKHEKVVQRALAKNRADRFQNMREFAAALADPHAYALNAPSLEPGNSLEDGVPAPRSGERNSVSGQVVFGGGGEAGFAARSRPLPTTFGQGVGELSDDAEVPHSRKGLVLGLMGAVAAAGLAAFFLFGRSDSTEPAPPSPAAVAQEPSLAPAVPEVPSAVKVSFDSEPAGVQVVKTSDNTSLGVTPFAKEFPHGKDAIEVRFEKAGFQGKILTFTPDNPARVTAALVRESEPEVARPVTAVRPPRERTRAPSPPRAEKRGDQAPSLNRPRRPRAPMDEDAVLEPTFD